MTVAHLRVSEAAALLGVSDDTVRRWADSGRLALTQHDSGPATIDGAQLAQIADELAHDEQLRTTFPTAQASARNRMTGIVTRVVRDTVMAQVELRAGPFRVVSLMSREAADELGLERGSLAVASVKATNVGIELPTSAGERR